MSVFSSSYISRHGWFVFSPGGYELPQKWSILVASCLRMFPTRGSVAYRVIVRTKKVVQVGSSLVLLANDSAVSSSHNTPLGTNCWGHSSHQNALDSCRNRLNCIRRWYVDRISSPFTKSTLLQSPASVITLTIPLFLQQMQLALSLVVLVSIVNVPHTKMQTVNSLCFVLNGLGRMSKERWKASSAGAGGKLWRSYASSVS